MSDIAIRVQGLSKQYQIGIVKQRHNTLRDELMDGIKSIFQRNGQTDGEDSIWALRDVSFEIKRGEIIGIIGRNGAGKSTLLKILSRITYPTTGRAEIYGRVGSLLEVGTGFHNELTGRQNVYLNGAILGMKKAEIDRKFDEIVAFAEVEKFIDTPVKRYSSGMHMRLAFAVAAHLEPEILIIDEVLAVGDLKYQDKCLGKMEDVASQGRTVLIVSHQIASIASLCTSAIWLDGGRIVTAGDVRATIDAYVESCRDNECRDPMKWKRRGTGEAKFLNIKLLDADGSPSTVFKMGDGLIVEFDGELHRRLPHVDMSLEIRRSDIRLPVLHLTNDDCGDELTNLSQGIHRFRVRLPSCLLYPGSYTVSAWIGSNGNAYDYVEDVLGFMVGEGNVSKRAQPFWPHLGTLFQPSIWEEI